MFHLGLPIERRGDTNVVKDDFMLSTAADIVADPSAPDAFVEGIMEVENGFGITVSGKSLILPLLKSLLITHR